jgi:hypothetical protein
MRKRSASVKVKNWKIPERGLLMRWVVFLLRKGGLCCNSMTLFNFKCQQNASLSRRFSWKTWSFLFVLGRKKKGGGKEIEEESRFFEMGGAGHDSVI